MPKSACRIVFAVRSALGLSSRGLAVSAAGCAGLAIWIVMRWEEFLAIAVMLGMLPALARMGAARRHHVRVGIGIPGRIVHVGDDIALAVTATNTGRRRSRRIRAELPVLAPTASRKQWFVIPRLAPGASWTGTVPFTASRRAVLRIGPVCARPTDPFGLSDHPRFLSDAAVIHVHPVTVTVPPPRIGFLYDPEGARTGKTVDDGLDFQSLREYRPGDDIRNAHWPSCAKTDTLMMRTYAAVQRVDTGLTLDSDPASYADEEEFEIAVSAYASLGRACLAANRPLSVSVGGIVSKPSDMTAFLDACSAIVRTGDDAGTGSFPGGDGTGRSSRSGIERRACQFLITGSGTPADRISGLHSSSPHADYRIVVQVDRKAPCRAMMLPFCMLLVVAALEDLPIALAVIPS